MMNLTEYFNQLATHGRPLEIHLRVCPNVNHEAADIKMIPDTNMAVSNMSLSWIPAYGYGAPQEIMDGIRYNVKVLLSTAEVCPFANTGGDDYMKMAETVKRDIAAFLEKLDDAEAPWVKTNTCQLGFEEITHTDSLMELNRTLSLHDFDCEIDKHADDEGKGDYVIDSATGPRAIRVFYADVGDEAEFYIEANRLIQKLVKYKLESGSLTVGNLVLTATRRKAQADDENYAIEP